MSVIPGWIGLDRAHREWAALTPDQRQEVGPLIPPEAVANAATLLNDCQRALYDDALSFRDSNTHRIESYEGFVRLWGLGVETWAARQARR